MRYLPHDIETHSTLSLRDVGSPRYAGDPTTDVWCVSYCFITDGVRDSILTWRPTEPIPSEIIEAAADPETCIVAHNDAFERQIEQHVLHPRYGWPLFPLERRRCTQASALSFALPADLDKAAAALKLPIRKTVACKKAMKKLAAPRKPRKGEDPTGIYWHDDPKDIATLEEYNRIDVEITAEIIRLIGFIPPREQEVWQLDAAINARGLCCDVELLDAALNIADQAAVDLKERIAALSDGEITGVAQWQRVIAWLARHGCDVPNVQKETLEEALKRPGLSTPARQMIELRLDGAHAAVSKFATMRAHTATDHRIRQAYRYHGAMPGRFASLGVQLQNLKKPTVPDIAAAIEDVRTGQLARMQARYKQPLDVVGDITRALIVPAPGHRLFIADLSGIESRGLAWLCNESTKLDAWREFDRTGKPENEPYYQFGVEELNLEGGKARSTGKTCDLAFGYQGSIGAWRRLAPADDATSDEEVYRRRRAWVRRHPNIERFWATSIPQAINAIENPGQPFTVARITFIREGNFLHMELPSGRRIRYPFARIYVGERGDKSFTFRDASGGRWEWYHVLKGGKGAFGGLIAENATQALCRDIFVDAMLRLEAGGYHIVAHLHDEFVCEARDDFGDLEEFLSIITAPPTWAPDFAVAAKARVADRFIEIKAPKAMPSEPAREEPEPITRAALDEIKEQPPAIDEPKPNGGGHAGNGRDSGGVFDNYPFGEAPRGEPTVRYTYKDARGLLYMRVTRTIGKNFPTQHWQDGKWVNGWPAEAIPYRLPELLAAPTAEPVWITEGEKDADNVAALGLIATTNPGGAKVFQAELAQWFKGKELAYALEDNDEAGACTRARFRPRWPASCRRL
jgi:DNA polymerase